MAFVNQVPDEAVDADQIARFFHADAALISIDLRTLEQQGYLVGDEPGRGYYLPTGKEVPSSDS
jgi:biotin operon repressor